MFGYIHDDKDKVHMVVKEILAQVLRRSVEDLEQMLLLGSLDECLQKIRNLVNAGVKQIHFWPVLDYKDQIRIFKSEYYPLACNCFYYSTVDNISALRMIQKVGPKRLGKKTQIWTQ